MSEGDKVCLRAGAASIFQTIQNNKRMEELISDLIRLVAKTHVKASDNEYELVQIKLMLAQLVSQNKYLYDHNEKLTERISALEQGEGCFGDRKKLRKA
ncbi:hypothetical protein [Peribacillus sp. NPDC097895]|uniref:hypothetical protein n=1 Tax=Peribacillus sp. NPDC097895 TaxID=3390619 RepID=UPI003D08BE32